MAWTRERVEALFNSVEENQHLDYKDGRFLKKDCQNDITKQVVGFANSDGGTLIIGVSEGTATLSIMLLVLPLVMERIGQRKD